MQITLKNGDKLELESGASALKAAQAGLFRDGACCGLDAV